MNPKIQHVFECTFCRNPPKPLVGAGRAIGALGFKLCISAKTFHSNSAACGYALPLGHKSNNMAEQPLTYSFSMTYHTHRMAKLGPRMTPIWLPVVSLPPRSCNPRSTAVWLPDARCCLPTEQFFEPNYIYLLTNFPG